MDHLPSTNQIAKDQPLRRAIPCTPQRTDAAHLARQSNSHCDATQSGRDNAGKREGSHRGTEAQRHGLFRIVASSLCLRASVPLCEIIENADRF